MTVPHLAAVGPPELHEPLTRGGWLPPLPPGGPRGLGLSARWGWKSRPTWSTWRRRRTAPAGAGSSAMLGAARAAAGRNAVTLEPGGQVELSGPPGRDVAAAAAELRHDVQAVRLALAGMRLGLAHAGADPARPSRRVNPRPRYRAMEQHYAATGRGRAGAVMMNSTAALQVNLQAGPAAAGGERVARAHRLGPTLVAISACSPWLHGRDTGWKSARQRAWAGLDPRACGPVPGCVGAARPPTTAWTRPRPGRATRWPRRWPSSGPAATRSTAVHARRPVRARGPAARSGWAAGAPTAADLDVHLTTLFPPVRLRGYLELRYLDMTPPRWWPAIAAVATTLMDDPVAADQATEATEPTARLWTEAARDGLGNAVLAESARRCVAIAAEPGAGRPGARPSPTWPSWSSRAGVRATCWPRRIAEVGPTAALEELAHA